MVATGQILRLASENKFLRALATNIDKKTLLLILVVSSINHFLLPLFVYVSTPQGYVYFPGLDDSTLALVLMKSHEWGFQNPYAEGALVFSDPVLTSSYYYTTLGIVSALLGLDYRVFFVLTNFLVSVIFMIVLSFIIQVFLHDRSRTFKCLLLLSITPGILFLLHVLALMGVPTFESLADDIQFLKSAVAPPIFFLIDRGYQAGSMVLGFVGILLTMRKKYLGASISIGLSSLVYPQLGFVFLLLAGLLLISERPEIFGNLRVFLKLISKFSSYCAVFLIFTLPWLISNLFDGGLFDVYRKLYFQPTWILNNLLANYFFLSVPPFIYILKRLELLKGKKFSYSLAMISGILFSFFAISQLNYTYFGGYRVLAFSENVTSFFRSYDFYIEALFFAAVFAIGVIFFKRENRTERFLILWLLLTLSIAIVNPAYIFWNPNRIIFLLIIPMAIVTYKFIPAKLFLPIAIVFLLLWSFQMGLALYKGNEPDHPNYWSAGEFEALKFLNGLPDGRIGAEDDKFSFSIPYYTGKKSLPPVSHYYPDTPGIYDTIFSDSADPKAKQDDILRYNLSYLIVSRSLDNYDFLTRIYEKNGIKIYKVGLNSTL